MTKKVCNNKVVFFGGGKELKMRLSDKELMGLRHSSDWRKGDNWESFTMGFIKNFAIYSLLDYDWKARSKAGRFYVAFPYKEYDSVGWYLQNS